MNSQSNTIVDRINDNINVNITDVVVDMNGIHDNSPSLRFCVDVLSEPLSNADILGALEFLS